jgi:hypothetical protein
MGFGHLRSCFTATSSFPLLSRLVGFIVPVIYKSLIDARSFPRNYSFPGRAQLSPGETSLGGSDTVVLDFDHLSRRDRQSFFRLLLLLSPLCEGASFQV